MIKKLFFIALAIIPLNLLGQTAFEQMIVSKGYVAGVTRDWSDSTTITIDEPVMGYVNIDGNTMPTSLTTYKKGWLEFYDGQGNYFKKRILMAAQGNSSYWHFPKKNFKVDMCEDEWVGDDVPEVTIGNWVPQDGFHFKAFYYDTFKGLAMVAYDIYDQVVADRGGVAGRAWSRSGVTSSKFDERAICHPDGFPVAVYNKGQFYGIYTFQLKKHRKNMNLIKDVPEMIHIDGQVSGQSLLRGTIQWKKVELRNPKKMYLMNGEEYDKNKRGEIMDETSEFYDLPDDDAKVKKHKQNTAIVKKHVIAFSKYYSELWALRNAKTPKEVMREEVQKRLDVESLIDFWLFTYYTNNYDGIDGNWQWVTWDGEKWFVLPYDLDCTFGLENYGRFIYPSNVCSYRGNITIAYHPFQWINYYFLDELYERYAQLRERRVFDTENVMTMLNEWRARIGDDMYAMEWERWPNSPCISHDVINDGWELVPNWSGWSSLSGYNAETTYQKGDIIGWHYRKWKATKTITGVPPCSQEGYTDTPERVREWLDSRLDLMDRLLKYTPKPIIGDVNGDGVADVTDVALLVEYLISGTGDINTYQADINGDRAVNISDITILVNNILNGTNANATTVEKE